jgi:hypothetical protein
MRDAELRHASGRMGVPLGLQTDDVSNSMSYFIMRVDIFHCEMIYRGR